LAVSPESMLNEWRTNHVSQLREHSQFKRRAKGDEHAVSSVENGVGNVGDLGSGGSRVVGHRLEHLGSDNDRLAGDVALGNWDGKGRR
jgi:hypothetical protein